MEDVRGKTAFITGGASGIGLGMAQAFAEAGMRIVIADIDASALARAEATLREAGATVVGVTLDVAAAGSWADAAAKAEREVGAIDVLCNNAGIAQSRIAANKHLELVDIPEGLWRNMLDINVTGAYLGLRTVCPGMIARGVGGHVVNTASVAGLLAPGGMASYATTKFALMGLSESVAAELAPHGIGVSILCPGGVQSNLVVNSAARRKAVAGADDGAASQLLAQPLPHAPKMSPRRVGDRVLQAILANELYVITHPEYKPMIEERHAAIIAAIGPSAEPGYHDSPTMLDSTRSRLYVHQTARVWPASA